VAYSHHGPRDPQFPSRLNQPPPCLGFFGKIWALFAFNKLRESIGYSNSCSPIALIGEKPQWHFVPAHDVERIDDVVESEANRFFNQFLLTDLSRVCPSARV
jgi:hypothetical protein